MNAVQRNLLIKVRQTWSDESKFCQGTAARDINGRACQPHYHGAVCWCFRGLLMVLGVEAFPELNAFDPIMVRAAQKLFPAFPTYGDAMSLNDTMGYSRMIQILDLAIKDG